MTERRKEAGKGEREPLSAELLHRHVDGELDEAGRAELLRAAGLDPQVRARVEGLLEVREIVREAVAAQTPEIDSDALWASIEAGIAEGDVEVSGEGSAVSEPKRPALRVIEGGGQAAPAPNGESAAGRRRRIGALVIGALAIAAVAFLALQHEETPVVATNESPVVPTSPEASPELAVVEEPAHTEVLEVDFGTNIGTIFSIEGEGGDRYAVVWLDEGPLDGAAEARPN